MLRQISHSSLTDWQDSTGLCLCAGHLADRPAVLDCAALAGQAARRWADTWSRAWPQRDAEAIAALYADTVMYRSLAFRRRIRAGVRRYLNEQLPAEGNIECWFGQPIVSGDRAAVEWWASWTEEGPGAQLRGVTVLHFDGQGKGPCPGRPAVSSTRSGTSS
jgi:SnoaL-like domain